MKSSEQIQLALSKCKRNSCSKECPYHGERACYVKMLLEAGILIRQLERERDEASEFHKELVETNNSLFAETVEMQNEINALRKELEQVKRERDAAVEDIFQTCANCKHEKLGYGVGPCPPVEEYVKINDCSNWQWRGVQEVDV